MENATDEKELAELILNIIENPPKAKHLEEIAQKLKERYKKENCGKLYILRFHTTMCKA